MKTRRLDTEDGWIPAGASWRLAATVIDMAAYCVICLVFAIPVSQSFDWSAVWGGIDEIALAASEPTWLGHASSILGLWIALWWCYFVVGWGLLGATPGKWAIGLRIMDYHQRSPIGPSRAVLRLAAYCVSSVTFEWGHLLILIRTDRRALHDVLSGTRVVRKSRRAMLANREKPEIEETEPLEVDERAADETPSIIDQY